MPTSQSPVSPADERKLGNTLRFMHKLWALTHAIQAKSKRMERSVGVTGPQRLVLRILGRLPKLTAGELAATLQLHPSTLTGILQRLEERGLVERASDDEDRRRVRLHLTVKGKQIDLDRGGTVEAAVRRALARSTDNDVRAAERLISVLVEELTKDT